MNIQVDRSKLRMLAVQANALRQAMEVLLNSSLEGDEKWIGFRNFGVTYNVLAEQFKSLTGSDIRFFNTGAWDETSFIIPRMRRQLWESVYVAVVQLGAVLMEHSIGRDAHVSELQDLIHANLRKVIFSKPEAEREIQNAIEALLIGRGMQKPSDFDRETGHVKFSGRHFIPDFIFPSDNLALEVKLITKRDDVSACVEQMSADIPAYLSVYESVLFVVYDTGEIRDVYEFQRGLQVQPSVRVIVIKH